ncbi:MAG: hypothetical protein SF187_22080 [Deltaproteobacteria bacterium]|nr:hypothetical protein [Deltaproteobacteria bacterium]
MFFQKPAAARSYRGVMLVLVWLSACKGDDSSNSADAAVDAGGDALGCPAVSPPDAGSIEQSWDDFGPNAALSKTPSALARVNIYEVTSPRWLTNAEIFLQPALQNTLVTIAVGETSSKTAPFKKLVSMQVPVPSCPGFVSAGPLRVWMVPGRYYSVGYDPNQGLNYASVSEMGTLPIDGAFGRLIGSRTDTSVSQTTLPWDKFSDKEYFRQRITTIPAPDVDAGASDARATDAATGG